MGFIYFFGHTIYRPLSSFPGPAQLSVACSTEKRFFVCAWGEPGNEANRPLELGVVMQHAGIVDRDQERRRRKTERGSGRESKRDKDREKI